jgi:hypothetical protein
MLWKGVKGKYAQNSVECELAAARKGVEQTERACEQQQQDITNADNARITTRDFEIRCPKMIIATAAIPNGFGFFVNVGNEDHENDQDTVLSKLTEEDKPSWVVGTVSKMVHQQIERYW